MQPAQSTDDTTIQVDPSLSDAIELQQPIAEAPPEEGPVSNAIEEAIPDTGFESVDSWIDTLSDAIGGMIDATVSHLPQIVIALILIILTAFLASWGSRWAQRFSRKLRIKRNLRDLIGKFAYMAIWFLGLVAAAGVVFPGLGMGDLVATAGLASIAIGLAFQDIFENLLAGVLIIWRFPFDDGDYIIIPSEDVEGSVEEVQIRMTLIRSVTGELILVPNATIYKNVVRVLTNKPERRLTIMCGIAYGENVGEGRRVIEEAVKSCQTISTTKPVEIFAQAFGASSIDFEVTWWTKPTPLDQRRSRDEVVEAVKSALDEAGIEIPYPYRTLVFSKNEPDIIDAVRAGRGPDTTDED